MSTAPAALMREARRQEEAELAVLRIEGTAVLAGAGHERWLEARLCNCTDGTHPELERGIADSPWYWTRDVAGVEALAPFYAGEPHVTRRHVVRVTLPEDGAS